MRLRQFIDWWGRFLHGLAYLLFNLLLICGFALIGGALILFAKELIDVYRGGGHGTHLPGVNVALRGLEIIFLAPLPAAVIYSVNCWLASVFWPNESDNHAPMPNPAYERLLVAMKAKVVHLMAAIVATEIVNRATQETGLSYEFTLCGLLLIALLCGFGFLLERKLD